MPNSMHKSFRIIIAVIILVSSQTTRAQDIEYARSVVKTLASPAFKGRGYFGGGANLASAYIAGEFKKSGLIPLNKGSYFQEFDLSVNTFPGKVELALNGQSLVTAKDYLIDASSPATYGKYKVYPIRRADLLEQKKLLDLIEEANDDFLLIDNRPIANETKEQKTAANGLIDALKTDKSLKLKGLIVYGDDKLTWTTLTYQGPRIVIQLNKQGLNPAEVHEISLNVDVKLEPHYRTRNVAGMIKGTSKLDSTIVITAHFDHLGMLGQQVYFPGANDNASGTAMLLSFVKQYGKEPPKYNTVFLAFSGEEIGILGSKFYIEHPLTELNKIKFLVNFDLAGTGEQGIKVVNATVHKQRFEQLLSLNAQYKLLSKVEPRGAACNSDHCWFHEKGIPSFFIYTQGGISAYHDIYDRSETLPLTAFESFFQLMSKFFEGL
jgi:aminopeptidase YwaD